MYRTPVFAATLFLAACASSELKDKTAVFATSADKSVSSFLVDFDKAEGENRDNLVTKIAMDGPTLALSKACGEFEFGGFNSEECKILTTKIVDNKEIQNPLETDFDLAYSRAAANALVAYAKALAELSSDPSQGVDKFEGAVVKAGAALTNLANARDTGTDRKAQLSALARITASVGGFALRRKRDAMLKSIIVAADPIIADAVIYLSAAEITVRTRLLKPEFQELQDLAVEVGDADDAQVRKTTYEAFIAKFDKFEAKAAQPYIFAILGKAHHQLVLLTEGNGSPEDIGRALIEFLNVANTVKTEVATLQAN